MSVRQNLQTNQLIKRSADKNRKTQFKNYFEIKQQTDLLKNKYE